jgi:uncharacterized protein involved in type VI secretion and phage assembly
MATGNTANYVAQPLLEIDGKTASSNSLIAELMEDILQLSVEESLHVPGMFTLVIKNDYFPGKPEQEQVWRYRDLLAIGKPVKIGFQSSTTAAAEFSEEQEGYVLKGEITAIETHFTGESQAPVIVRGYDVSHRLHRGRYNRSFQNMTDSDIVKKITEEIGIEAGTVDASGSPHDYVFQENQTNMQFLRERAARIGFELFIQDGKIYFRKPKSNAKLQLKWLTDLHSFRVRVTSAEQVDSVEVRGWDYKEKKAIVSNRNRTKDVITETQNGKGRDTSTKFKLDRTPPKMIVVDQPITSSKEADTLAQALYDELGGEFIYADAKGEGNPEIRPGKIVELKGMGQYSGNYYITETRHLFHQGVYTTDLSVRGLRGGNLFTMLTPQAHLKPGQTHLVGIVTDNNDPEGLGRVKVKFPTLTEDHNSNWARVVAVGAANDRGFDCLPEVNDEVLVVFEHGDIHRPFVLGGIWNGKDAPPAPVGDSVQGGKVRLRTFKTRTGHQLQFVEEDKGGSKAGVYIDTTGGHKLRLNDSDRFIELETTGGHKIRLDDRNMTVDIKTSGGHTISMSDRSRNITISSNGTLRMEAAANMDIKAGGILNISGAMIKLN